MRDIRYVVFHSPGPRWQPGKPLFEQDGVQDHVNHYRPWAESGKLAMGGPFLDGAAGGMMIPSEAMPQAEIEEFAQADPAVRSGLLVAQVRPWLVGMKK
jgi:uncharacterized protein YciI